MQTVARIRVFTSTLLTTHDSSTEAGRAAERQRRVILSAGTSGGSQIVSVILGLLMVPIALSHFGAEQYGLWITLTTALGLFTFADLGIGNGLINAIGEAHGKNDKTLARSYVSNGLMLQSIIGFILAFIVFGSLAVWQPNWQSIFSLGSSKLGDQAAIAIGSLICLTLISLPLTVAQRVRMGYQEGYINNLYLALGAILSFGAGILAIQKDWPLAAFIACFATGPVLVQILNTLMLFTRRSWLRPSIKLINRQTAASLLRIGSLFLILQLAASVAYTADNIVISSNLGADVVPEFAVPLKIFSLPIMASGFILQPLWPAYREAGIRSDHTWIRSTLKRSLITSIGLTAICALVLVIIGQPLTERWTDGSVTPSFQMLALLGIYTVMYVASNALAMFYNGLHIVRFQVFIAVPMAVTNVITSIYLVQRMGPEGVALGSIIAIGLCTFVPSAFFVPRFLHALTNVAPQPAEENA